MPKENEMDLLLVANPDVNCDEVDSEKGYNHKDYFEVKWGGFPHRIAPGQQKRMPRFLAKHFAKHLADHLLMRKEKETGLKNLVQSATERPKMLAMILLGVDSYFHEQENPTEGEKVGQEVEELNPQEKSKSLDLGTTNIGQVTDPMLGVLKPSVERNVVDPEEEKGKQTPWDKMPRAQLFEECDKLGIETLGNERRDVLIDKLKKF